MTTTKKEQIYFFKKNYHGKFGQKATYYKLKQKKCSKKLIPKYQ